MPPYWKFLRELNRLKLQLQSIPEFFYEPWIRKRYDSRRDSEVRVTFGRESDGSKYALFLVFQPQGLALSTLDTCKHLSEHGYKVLLVSNAPLRSADITSLKEICWRLIERPNFGYDFGGYRDGIWWLQQQGVETQFLLILNDSIWFPVKRNSDWLLRMESTPANFIGALQMESHRSDINKQRRKPYFYGSFFWLLKKQALEHPMFIQFWNDYQNTNNKYKTVQRGEREFSKVMRAAGVSHDFIFSRTVFDRYLEQSSPLVRLDILRNLNVLDDSLREQRDKFCESYEDTDVWSASALNQIMLLTNIQNILVTAPIACLQHFQVPFIKKARTVQNMQALKLIEKNADQNDFRLTSVVLNEITALIKAANK